MQVRAANLLLLIGIFFVDFARPCSCIRGEGPGEAFRKADVVVSGTVIEVAESRREARSEHFFISKSVKIAVNQAWKGLQGENEVVVHTGSGGGDCGFGFKKGEKYLIYAYRAHNPPHRLTTGICTRTATHGAAKDDLLYLKRLPLLKSSYVYGYVRRQQGSWSNATVALINQFESRTTKTDENGRFEFEELSTGEYQVKLLAPEEFDPDPFEHALKLWDRDCAEVLFYPRPGSRIEGAVKDLTGRPAVRLKVKGGKLDNYGRSISAPVDERGRFVFQHIPPGEYRIGLDFSSRKGYREPLDFYYPGTRVRENAIRLGPGIVFFAIKDLVDRFFEFGQMEFVVAFAQSFPLLMNIESPFGVAGQPILSQEQALVTMSSRLLGKLFSE